MLPYRRHYILSRRMKICFLKTQFFHSNQAARQSQSHPSRHLLALVGGILKSLSSRWRERDNGGRALLRRGLWRTEPWCTEECELPCYLGMSLKRPLMSFPAHTTSVPFSLPSLHSSCRNTQQQMHTMNPHTECTNTSCCWGFILCQTYKYKSWIKIINTKEFVDVFSFICLSVWK